MRSMASLMPGGLSLILLLTWFDMFQLMNNLSSAKSPSLKVWRCKSRTNLSIRPTLFCRKNLTQRSYCCLIWVFLIDLTVLLPFDIICIFLRHRLVNIIGDKTIEIGITRCVNLLQWYRSSLGEVVLGVTIAHIVYKSLDTDEIDRMI